MKETIYFGTYTRKNSQGIYCAHLDLEKGKVNDPQNIIKVDNPTYLQITNSHSILSVVGEAKHGGIANYNLTDNSFNLLNQQLTNGSSPCYIGYNSAHQLVAAAYYHRGTAELYRLNDDGSLTLTDKITQHGNGLRPEQDGSHIHYTDFTPDNRLVVIDLGNDTLNTYNIDYEGKLKLQKSLNFDPGFGPRHLVFANEETAYLVAELSSKIAVLHYDSQNGQFTMKQVLSTIPQDFREHNGAAAIRISNDKRFVYVSNRGHNSIATFKVQSNGLLKSSGWNPTEGSFPRDFALDPSNRFLLVVNQNTDNATLFKRDSQSGKLDCIQQDIRLPEGVCVCFQNEKERF